MVFGAFNLIVLSADQWAAEILSLLTITLTTFLVVGDDRNLRLSTTVMAPLERSDLTLQLTHHVHIHKHAADNRRNALGIEARGPEL